MKLKRALQQHRNITFTNVHQIDAIEKPQPASKLIPDWYKDMDSYLTKEKVPDGKGGGTGTIKRCMPVFDALNAGYYLLTDADVWVTQVAEDPNNPDKKTPYYQWASGSLAFHVPEQASLHPTANGYAFPKWSNPWAIKTPKGYSTLFIAPVHRDNPFVALPGIVDTDTYTAPVNIIFTLADPNFEGLVPKGTPIAQVIPFKRDSWKMEFGGLENVKEQAEVTAKLTSKFFDRYKDMFRAPKEYR
jgi:hypothetical protein